MLRRRRLQVTWECRCGLLWEYLSQFFRINQGILHPLDTKSEVEESCNGGDDAASLMGIVGRWSGRKQNCKEHSDIICSSVCDWWCMGTSKFSSSPRKERHRGKTNSFDAFVWAWGMNDNVAFQTRGDERHPARNELPTESWHLCSRCFRPVTSSTHAILKSGVEKFAVLGMVACRRRDLTILPNIMLFTCIQTLVIRLSKMILGLGLRALPW